jgi:hypothetical protein
MPGSYDVYSVDSGGKLFDDDDGDDDDDDVDDESAMLSDVHNDDDDDVDDVGIDSTRGVGGAKNVRDYVRKTTQRYQQQQVSQQPRNQPSPKQHGTTTRLPRKKGAGGGTKVSTVAVQDEGEDLDDWLDSVIE